MKISTAKVSIIFSVLRKWPLTLGICFFALGAFAEGTKQINPSSSDNTYLEMNSTVTNIPFATWNCPKDYRLNITICNPNEKIYMGFQTADANSNNVYFRLKDSLGNIVMGPTRIPTTNGSTGYINSYNQAVAGPAALGIAGGYNAFVYNNPSGLVGDFYIEFNVGTTYSTGNINLRYFDITVANGTNAASIKPGRLWSKDWELNTGSYTNRFNGKMFVYANDGIVTKIDFNGMQPYRFHVACNSKGTANTGNFANDRLSKVGNQTYPEYKIFLNNPDIDCFPTGTFGTIDKDNIKVTGCYPNYCINIDVRDKPGTIGIILDLNGQAGYQPNSKDISISYNAVTGINCIPWDGKDGLGNQVAPGTIIDIQIDFFNGITNLPLYDVEDNANGFIVTLERPSGPAPRLFWDDTQIMAGTATDGKVMINPGCVAGTTIGCHRWRNRGDNNCGVSCPESINTWWYANIVSGSTQFTSSQIDVDADADTPGKGSANARTVCGNGSPVPLKASKISTSPTIWTTTGSGTFSAPSSLTGTYTPSAADITAGKVNLIITIAGTASCPSASDTIPLTLQKPPVVGVGTAPNVCENSPNIQLQGTQGNGVTAIRWTAGAGSFTSNTSLSTIYTPTTAEINAGTVNFTLTSTAGNGVCAAASSTLAVSITKAPTVNAGSTTSICANNPVVNLAGNIGNGAINPTWSGGTLSGFSNINDVNAKYTPTAAEINSGSVTLTLSASKANCNSVSSTVRINFTAAPVISAGPAQSLCENNAAIQLAGTFNTAVTAAQWSGGNGTYNPNNTARNAIYTPTAAELNAGLVQLTYTTTSAGNCTQTASSPVTFTFTKAPKVNAGNDFSVCVNKPSVTLAGTSTTGGGTWTGFGGTFTPSANVLGATYTVSPGEIASTFTALILTSTGNNNCNAVSDTVLITFDPSPTANAGNDAQVCKNNLTLQLNGTTTNASSVVWTTNGTGTFSNTTIASPIYTPSAADTVGTVTLTFTANQTKCNSVSDQMQITFNNVPKVNAGSDKSVCNNNPTTTISGTSSTGSGTWTGGTGTLVQQTSYTASAAEVTAGNPVTLTFTSTNNGNCNPVSSKMNISFTPSPVVNAGRDSSFCVNNVNIALKGTSSTTRGRWTGGAGTYNASNTDLNATYTPAASEISAGSSITLTLTSTNNGNCNAEKDEVTFSFTPAPVANAGTDKTSCANNPNIALVATASAPATGGIWSGNGGTFTPNNSVLNPTYTPSNTEIQAGTSKVKFSTTGSAACKSVADSVIITIAPAPTADAGPDKVVCGDVTTVPLTGTITNAPGGIWSVIKGTGTFSGANTAAASATYTPSGADIDSGYVELRLTSAVSGTCNAVSDMIRIFFTAVPKANAGSLTPVCTNALPVQLNGTGNLGTWSGGAGTFTPDNRTLNAKYQPTASEIAAGKVLLRYATDPTATCLSKWDTILVRINPAPVVNAGNDLTLCSNTAPIAIAGTVTNAAGGKWSTTGTGTFSNTTTLTPTYNPSAADKNTGALTIILTSTGNGYCPAVTDTLKLTLKQVPVINAGPDQTFCKNNSNILLKGTINDPASNPGTWTGGNGTFVPNNKTTNAVYTPTAGELAANSVTLTFASTPDPVCPSVSDDVTFSFTPSPTVDAGADQTFCETAIPVNVAVASITIATTGIWTSKGTGTFAPTAASTTSKYMPSAADINTGAVKLFFTTSDNATCNPVTDSLTLNITKQPVVDAGKDTLVCANTTGLTLYGKVANAASQKWTSSGTGTFDVDSKLDAVYTPSQNDRDITTVTLTLEATGNGTCGKVRDRMVVSFRPVPTALAGPDRHVCEDISFTKLAGKITNAKGSVWTTAGTGTFTHADSVQTEYLPSAADIAATSVRLTLTTTGTGVCAAATSSFTLRFDPRPTINVGADQNICSDSSGVVIVAATTHASGQTWANSGNGTFSPSTTASAPKFVPSISDRAKGSVKVWATTTGSGTCSAVTDTMNVLIAPKPTVDAGTDFNICETQTSVTLNGTIDHAGYGKWTTTGTGTFSPSDSTDLKATYNISAQDITNGSIVLTLTTRANGLCKPVADQLNITINKKPTANAGADRTYCKDVSSIPLSGSFTRTTAATWTSLGGGSLLPDNQTMTANYFPTSTELTAGKATLVLTAKGTEICEAVTDSVSFFFTPIPTVNAGTDIITCADKSSVTVSGASTSSANFVWSTLGTGTFAPNTSTLNPSYKLSTADITAGTVNLVLTTLNNSPCSSRKDTVTVTIGPKPTINVGSNQTLCIDDPEKGQVSLQAVIANAKGVKWSTSGSGAFSTADTLINPIYLVNGADISLGSIQISAVTTGNGTCDAVYSDLRVIFSPYPEVNSGANLTSCEGTTPVQLGGAIKNAPGATWTTSGSGTFTPNNTDMNAQYVPSPTDVTDGEVVLSLITDTYGVCQSLTSSFALTFNNFPVINAGRDSTYCTNNLPIKLQGSGASATWSGGAGTFSPSNAALTAEYTPTPAEISSGTINLTLTTPAGACPPTSDNVVFTILQGPSVNAGLDDNICANTLGYTLNGTQNASTNSVKWTTPSGTGTFTPNNSLSASFVPSAQQIANGQATLILTGTGNALCPVSTDQVVLTIAPAPTVSAGFAQSVCKDVTTVNLNGAFTVAGGVQWTSSSGLGTFANATNAVTTFTPDIADKNAGAVTLTLTTTGNNLCIPENSTVTIAFTPTPTAVAGNDTTLCTSNLTRLSLHGAVTIASSGVWSSTGTGKFSPDSTSLNTKYIPSAADLAGTGVTFTLTTSGNGTCQPVTSNRIYNFDKIDSVYAGPDLSLCANAVNITVNNTFSSNPNVKWTTNGSGVFTPDNTVATNYSPSSADFTKGGISFTLSSTSANTCPSVADFATVSFSPIPAAIVNAGTDQTICVSVPSVKLNGFIANAKGGKWTTAGDGTFAPNDTTLEAQYKIGANDLAAGKTGTHTVITLTSTGNGPCGAVSDNFHIIYQNLPTISVSTHDVSACSDVDSINLAATPTLATTGVWSTTGTGFFAPKSDSLATSYFPTASDIALGQVWAIVSSVNNGVCEAAQDTAKIKFTPIPSIDAGPDKEICRSATSVPLVAKTKVATGGIWTASGQGSFSNPNALNTNYLIVLADTNVDQIVVKVTSTGQGTCKPVSDYATITFNEIPTVDAGQDLTTCESTTGIPLNPVTKVATNFSWASTGTGTFLPDANTLNATYVPATSDADITGGVVLSLTSVKNNACPPVSDNLNITLQKVPVLTASAAAPCYSFKGMQLTATLQNASGAKWVTDGAGAFSPDNTNMNATYYFAESDINSNITLSWISNPGICPADTANATANVALPPTANAGPDQYVCPSQDATIFTQALPNLNYEWNVVATGNTESYEPYLHVNIAADTDYELVVSDQNGCNGKDTVTVRIVPKVDLILKDKYCLDPYVAITAEIRNDKPDGSFQWYKNDQLLQGQVDTSIYATDAGEYKLQYTLGFCTYADSAVVNDLPILVHKDKVACKRAHVSIRTSSINNAVYTWKSPASSTGTYNSFVDPLQSVPDTIFTYVDVKDMTTECQSTDSIRIIGLEKPNFALRDTSLCEGQSHTLDATPVNAYPGFTPVYSWTKNRVSIPGETLHTLVVDKTGLYGATASIGECASDTNKYANVIFNELPINTLTPAYQFCPVTDRHATLDAGSGSDNPNDAKTNTYVWSDAQGNTIGTTQKIQVDKSGTYSVILKNVYGCPDTNYTAVKDLCGPIVNIPNAFTPGKPGTSGKDDKFFVQGQYFKNYNITIYSRWGEVIFHSENSNQDSSWDGTYLGQEMPIGVYPYVITYDAEDPKVKGKQRREGSITLLR